MSLRAEEFAIYAASDGAAERADARATFRSINQSGIRGLNAGRSRDCDFLVPLRDEEPRGRPRLLGIRANESGAGREGPAGVDVGTAETSDCIASGSIGSSGSSGGGVLPDAEAILSEDSGY